MFDDDLNIIIKQDVSLTAEQWAALQNLAQAGRLPSISKLMGTIADNPALTEKIQANLVAKSIDYEDIFNTPVVRPLKPVTETLSFIQIEGDTVMVRHNEKNDDWIGVVKPLGYYWDRPLWIRNIKPINGAAAHRAAELGYNLLKNGFCVVFPNPDIRDMAISQRYEPEQRRWVMARTQGKGKNHFYIHWERGEDCYDEAKAITGATYDKPGILVPPEYYEEVLDFADINKFELTQAAQELVQKCQKWRESAMVVSFDDIEIDTEEMELPEFIEVEIPHELIDDPV